MEVIEVNIHEYTRFIRDSFHKYGCAEFNSLYSDKCESVHYLLFKSNKYYLGMICGLKGNILYSPFSAPFGGFSFLNNNIRINHIDEALDILIDWIKKRGYSAIIITPPPSIYYESFISKVTNGFFRKNFIIDNVDLNYSFNLSKFNDTYINSIWNNARKNLKKSFSAQLSFSQCTNYKEKMLAYKIIKHNRKIRGFPIKMSSEQVMNTSRIIDIDFFLLKTYKGIPIAASIVFHITNDIVQVVFWGDLPEYNQFRTMNYLSYKVFEFYSKLGKRIVDIGPSTENSIPNPGLCAFKESIGCDISTKMTFRYRLY